MAIIKLDINDPYKDKVESIAFKLSTIITHPKEAKKFDFNDFKKIQLEYKNHIAASLVFKPLSTANVQSNKFQNIKDYNFLKNDFFRISEYKKKFMFKLFVISIFNVYTHPDFRQQGLQRKLFELLFNEYSKYSHFFLYAIPYMDWEGDSSKFKILDKFYQSLGFKHYDFLVKPSIYMYKI
jgi:GNAT superfamily N-acetyltransferase